MTRRPTEPGPDDLDPATGWPWSAVDFWSSHIYALALAEGRTPDDAKAAAERYRLGYKKQETGT